MTVRLEPRSTVTWNWALLPSVMDEFTALMDACGSLVMVTNSLGQSEVPSELVALTLT